MKVLVVTNDFPPRPGGIQSFVHGFASRLPGESVIVYASDWKGSAAFDAAQPFAVVRENTGVLLPTPRVARRARDVLRAEGCDAVWFGAAAPLGLLGRGLRAAGAARIVASTHGHEIGWARLPGPRQALRRVARSADVVTYLGEYTRTRLAAAFGAAAERLRQLPPGVDGAVFRPEAGRAAIRARYGLSDEPVVVCVSRLVPRKGQDVLIRSLPAIRRRVSGAHLLLVGGGPDRGRLVRLAEAVGVGSAVTFTGSVPWEELAAHYAAGDVFAMPCRTRFGGLDVEGLGVVYLEASAVGLPVVAGRSGGAPDAVREGETGFVVDGTSVPAVAERVSALLGDPAAARAMGAVGRAWIERDWRWDVLAARLRAWLDPAVPLVG